MVKILLIGLLTALLLSGCGWMDNARRPIEERSLDARIITKYRDEEAKVTCWIVNNQGIDCLADIE